MKKKLLVLALAALTAISCAFGFAGCSLFNKNDANDNKDNTEQSGNTGGNKDDSQGGNQDGDKDDTQGEDMSKGEAVTKQEWNAAISASVFENFTAKTVDRDGASIIKIDGYKVETVSQFVLQEETHTYHYFYDKEGDNYFEYKYDDTSKRYIKKPIEKDRYDGVSAEGLAKGFEEMLVFENYTYSDGGYRGEFKDMQLTVLFENKKLASISYTRDNNIFSLHTVTFTEYGSTTVNIPGGDMSGDDIGDIIGIPDLIPDGSEYKGQAVTEREWNAAISASIFKNFTVKSASRNFISTIKISGEKIEIIAQEESFTAHCFYDKEGDNYFLYRYDDTSNKYIKNQITKEDYEDVSGEEVARGLAMLGYSNFKYSGGRYYGEIENLQFTIIFEDGKIVYIGTTTNDDVFTYRAMIFSDYGTTTVTIPSGSSVEEESGNHGGTTDGEAVTEEEWNAIFATENFDNVRIFRAANEIEWDVAIAGNLICVINNTNPITTTYFEKDGENYYEYSQMDDYSGFYFEKKETTAEKFDAYCAESIKFLMLKDLPHYTQFKRVGEDFYIAETDDVTVTIYCLKGKIDLIEFKTADGQILYNYGFDRNAIIELPEKEYIVTQVTEDAWNALLAPSNFVNVHMYDPDNSNDDYIYIGNGKIFVVHPDAPQPAYNHYEKIGEKYYFYEEIYGNSGYFYKREITSEEYNRYSEVGIVNRIKELLPDRTGFKSFNGVYYMAETENGVAHVDFNEDGKIREVSLHTAEGERIGGFYFFDYGQNDPEMPSEEWLAVPATQESWSGAFENTLNSQFYGGLHTGEIHNEYSITDNLIYAMLGYDENGYFNLQQTVYYSIEGGQYYKYLRNVGENDYLRTISSEEEFNAFKANIFKQIDLGSFEDYYQISSGGFICQKEGLSYSVGVTDGKVDWINIMDMENDYVNVLHLSIFFDAPVIDLPTDFVDA